MIACIKASSYYRLLDRTVWDARRQIDDLPRSEDRSLHPSWANATGVGHGLQTMPTSRYEQVIPDWAEATTISMLGPVMCSALTVIVPVFPAGELVCSFTITVMPPGKEMARFGLATRTGCPATIRPTSSELPVTAACPPLQLALEFDFTTSAATRPPNKLRFTTDDCD